MQAVPERYRRPLLGGAVSLGGLLLLTLLWLPFRTHLSVATPALTFVVPVIAGVVVGGFAPGVLGALAGFVLYDLFFLRPYGRLTVQAPEDWIALGIYVLVVLLVARLVSNLKAAREQAHRREDEAGRLFELSKALIGDFSLSQLLDHIATTVQAVFGPRWTAVLLPAGQTDNLTVAANSGAPLTLEDVASLTESAGQTRSLGMMGDGPPRRAAVALVASNRPVGMLVLHEVRFAHEDRTLLGTFANQAALAVERAQLREKALRSQLLEEVDRWHRAMMGAVSHDLRTPLASVKTAVSSLRQKGSMLGDVDRAELLELIELQSDRLARLVTNLLDMTRIESGALEVRPAAIAFEELIEEVLASVRDFVPPERVVVEADSTMLLLEVDHVLIGQVLINLLENAARLSPPGSNIRVAATGRDSGTGHGIEISVADEGPGIPAADRDRVFEMFSQRGGGGRAGLGLAIAKAFVEAHGGCIWIDPSVAIGARVVFSVPSGLGMATSA